MNVFIISDHISEHCSVNFVHIAIHLGRSKTARGPKQKVLDLVFFGEKRSSNIRHCLVCELLSPFGYLGTKLGKLGSICVTLLQNCGLEIPGMTVQGATHSQGHNDCGGTDLYTP